MSSAQFNIAMVLRADTGSAKAGLADVATGLKAVSTEAGKTGTATAKEAAELDRLASAAAKAALAQTDLAAAERAAQASRAQTLIAPLVTPKASPLAAAWRTSETAASSLRDTVAGLSVTVGQQAHDFVETAQAAGQWRAAMDDVRASFNPLYAASRQYEQQLDRIAEAERLGAISAREAAAAREQASRIIAPAAGGMASATGINNGYTANVAAQGFDIGVTAAMGMNPMMIGLQQGTQLVQVMQQMGGGKQALAGIAQGFLSILNPMSLATVGIVAFGALAIQGLMKVIPSAKSLEDRMNDLNTAFERYRDASAISAASADELAEKFGAGAEAAQGLYQILADLSRLSVDQKLSDTSSVVREKIGLTKADMTIGRDGRNFTRFFGLGSGYAAESANSERIDAFGDALKGFETAKGAEAQTAAMQVLLEQVQELATLKGGVSEKEQGLIDLLKQQADILLGIQAAETARQERIKRQIDETVRGYGQQSQLQRTILQYGQDSAQVRAVENRQERENLALKLEKLGLSRQDADWQRAMGALTDLQHQRELAALDLKRQWFQDQDDKIAAIRRETALIGASASEQIRINALAEAEVDIRKRKLGVIEAVLVRMRAMATAQAEIDQARARALKDLTDAQTGEMFDAAIAGTRDPYARAELEAQREYARQIATGADRDIAAGNAALVKARALRELQASQSEYLRGQDENLAQLRLELALVGQTAEVRARVLALAQAEQDIQSQGLQGAQADRIRQQALEQAEMARTIEAQADAWQRVQSAGEAAVDGVLDKLRGGDVKGAMAEMLGEIEKGFFDLAIRNPLKNALFGTNLGTWKDVGGLSGIWGRLTGANPVDEGKLARNSVLPLQTMTVTAGNVILQGNLSGIPALTGAANTNAAPMSFAGGLPGSADVQSQIWQFFAAKGLQPHQIAGIMGQVSAESGFNPGAVGDNGTSLGLFQHHAGRGQGLLNAVGGMGGLGNVDAQLEFMWKELLTSENGALQRIMASTNVQQATAAAVGFERPQGWTAGNPQGAHNFDGRLAAAEQALVQFGNSVRSTGAQVDTGGTRAATGLTQAGQGAMVASQGMGAFGQVLTGIGGMVGGKTGSILGNLVGIGNAFLKGTPLFKTGGFTGGSDPDRAAGIVHEGEFVFDAVATRRIGIANLEGIRKGGMRGFRSGGYVSASPAAQAANAGSAPTGRSAPSMHVSVDVSGARGDKEIETMVQQAVAAGVSQSFDAYDREVLPSRVREISNDRWGS